MTPLHKNCWVAFCPPFGARSTLSPPRVGGRRWKPSSFSNTLRGGREHRWEPLHVQLSLGPGSATCYRAALHGKTGNKNPAWIVRRIRCAWLNACTKHYVVMTSLLIPANAGVIREGSYCKGS